jgi:RNA polymerase II-associated protein 3
MDDFMTIQSRMRKEAEEQADALSMVRSWMGDIAVKDRDLQNRQNTRTIQEGNSQTYIVNNNTVESVTQQNTGETAAKHTYDKGYKRWDKFDVDAALRAVDGEEEDINKTTAVSLNPKSAITSVTKSQIQTSSISPLILPPTQHRDPLEEMRLAGNEAIMKGDAASAMKFYSRLLIMNPQSQTGYANRAQAYLLLKEFRLAILDSTDALRLDPMHTKSWMRRAAARDKLGFHEAAQNDLRVAQLLEPSNRAIIIELRKVEETVRNCKKRLPNVKLKIV